MRKNDNNSKRGPRTSGGAAPRGTGAGSRGGRPKTGSGFKSRGEGRTSSNFGDKPEGPFERKPRARTFDERPGTDRDDRKPFDRGQPRTGGSGENRSTDWSTGGYRITKKGTGAKKTEGFQGYKKDGESAAGGFRGPRRDSEPRAGGFRGPRRDSEPRAGGFRGPRRDSDSRTEGFRGSRRDSDSRTEGFRGPRRDSDSRTEGFRGPRRDSDSRTEGFRGPRRDSDSRTEGFKGQRRDSDSRTGGFKGPRRDAEPRAAGFKGNRSFEVRGRKDNTDKKFDNKPLKEDVVTKKDVIRDFAENDNLDNEDRVEGRNPVFEAVRSGRPLNKLFVEKDSEDTMISRIVAMAREKNIPIQYLERNKLDSMSQTRIHQGVILDVAAQEYVEVEDILAKAAEKEEKPFILVLDEITDTNNLGSIIRSAECAGVHGIIIPKRRSATLNATVAKVAAGALEYVPVARVTNLVQTLRELKEEGVWIIGADMEGASNYYDADLKGACALVIGSEGEGLARLVKEECDLMVKIPMKGKISSLNAGVAAALIMFEITKQRG